MSRSVSHRTLAAILAGAALVSACATATPYRPATGSGFNRTGFSDQRIEGDRYRVQFAGNSFTARETVERYLLFRAAELTLSTGNDHFTLVDRDTDKQTRTYTTPGIGYGGYGPWGGWSPRWSYYGRGFGWRHWSPFWGDPFWDRGVDVRTVERYEASAEIVVGRGPKPNNVRSFSAREVVDNIGPTVRLPEQR